MMEVGVTCGGVWWPTEAFQAVEEVGFDTIWTGEHIVFHRPILDATPLLAAVAAVTRRVRIGPAAILVPLRNPTILAKELATIDIISGGRLTVVAGVGGDYPKEFEACEVPMTERGRRTSESIEIMRRYWSGEHFSYEGKIHRLDDVWMDPVPVQPGGPPIWLAGRTDAAMRRAARLGDGFMPYMYTPERCREAFEQIKANAVQSGGLRDGFVRSCFAYVSLDDDPAKARELAIRDLSWRYGKDFEPWIDKYCVHGNAETCATRLREFAAIGVQHLALGMIHSDSVALDSSPSLAASEATLDAIERFGRQLLPALRAQTSGSAP